MLQQKSQPTNTIKICTSHMQSSVRYGKLPSPLSSMWWLRDPSHSILDLQLPVSQRTERRGREVALGGFKNHLWKWLMLPHAHLFSQNSVPGIVAHLRNAGKCGLPLYPSERRLQSKCREVASLPQDLHLYWDSALANWLRTLRICFFSYNLELMMSVHMMGRMSQAE